MASGHQAGQEHDHYGLDIYRQSAYREGMGSELRGPSFFVLTALADGPRHGYGVIQEVERLSEGRTRLRAGTLYSAFDRLSAEGLIELANEELVDGRLRRNYRLTRSGRAVLSVESRRRMAISKEALRRLRLSEGPA
jgi:PadR family transcriptional regulator PadR